MVLTAIRLIFFLYPKKVRSFLWRSSRISAVVLRKPSFHVWAPFQSDRFLLEIPHHDGFDTPAIVNGNRQNYIDYCLNDGNRMDEDDSIQTQKQRTHGRDTSSIIQGENRHGSEKWSKGFQTQLNVDTKKKIKQSRGVALHSFEPIQHAFIITFMLRYCTFK